MARPYLSSSIANSIMFSSVLILVKHNYLHLSRSRFGAVFFMFVFMYHAAYLFSEKRINILWGHSFIGIDPHVINQTVQFL